MSSAASTEPQWPNQREGDFFIKDFRFGSGETLAELKLHYVTIGTPRKNAAGDVENAVLLIHNTSGGSKNWMTPGLAGELFGAGQPLDASRYFLVIPDSIGFGGSSKPSDGLKGKFPHYRYRDAIEAQHRLVTEGLGIKHLRMIVGISMGGMHAWMWGELYPDFMDGLVPIASQPSAISGRNWIQRRVIIEAIRRDPEWNGGMYEKNPSNYVYVTPFTALMTGSVVRIQEAAPSREKGDAFYFNAVEQAKKGDANDQLYALESIMDYDPSKDLEKIKAKVLAINFADDAVNPPELDILEPAMKRIRDGKFVLVPPGKDTHGHYTNLRAGVWKSYLADFIKELESAR
jgi:homoserine O-acetyltransferase